MHPSELPLRTCSSPDDTTLHSYRSIVLHASWLLAHDHGHALQAPAEVITLLEDAVAQLEKVVARHSGTNLDARSLGIIGDWRSIVRTAVQAAQTRHAPATDI